MQLDRSALEARFWSKVQKSDACWLWTAATERNGYGRFGIGRRVFRAHRVSWWLHFGPVPGGLYVCHHCDVRLCVRPDHLFLGTCGDNLRDMVSKGRGRSPTLAGVQHPQARLDAEAVAEVRRRYAAGDVSQRKLAQEYGLAQSSIGGIVRGESYKNPKASQV